MGNFLFGARIISKIERDNKIVTQTTKSQSPTNKHGMIIARPIKAVTKRTTIDFFICGVTSLVWMWCLSLLFIQASKTTVSQLKLFQTLFKIIRIESRPICFYEH